MKLVIVHNIPAPYRVEFFNALAAHPDVDALHVLFCAPGLQFRPWSALPTFRFSHEILKDYPLTIGHSNYKHHFNPGILRRLAAFRGDWLWINYSYVDPTCIVAGLWRTLRGWPWLLMTEAPQLHSRASARRRVFRRALLQPAVVGSRGIMVLGAQESLDYFRHLVPSRLPMRLTPYYVDITRHLAIGERRLQEWTIRDGGPLRFMYSGQLASYSNVETILRAFERVAATGANCTLEIVGNGAHRPALEAMVPQELGGQVTFHGGKDWAEMPDAYAQADVLVHATPWQAWGMVVTEALASGLPVIASRTTGAASYLVRDGLNGFLFDSGDCEALAGHMLHFWAHRDRLREFAAQAVAAARRVSLDRGVEEYVQVVRDLAFA